MATNSHQPQKPLVEAFASPKVFSDVAIEYNLREAGRWIGVGFLLVLCLYTSYKIVWWLLTYRDEVRAKVLVREFDEAQLSLAEVIELERGYAGLPRNNDGVDGIRFRPRRSHRIACSLAWEAYEKFGHRVRSEANLLITRKFMLDQLKEFKDLRACDRSGIIDRALYLSFLPSLTLQEMNVIDRTSAFNRRSSDLPRWSWWRMARRSPRQVA
jgi:hypothetical protein